MIDLLDGRPHEIAFFRVPAGSHHGSPAVEDALEILAQKLPARRLGIPIFSPSTTRADEWIARVEVFDD